MPNRQLVPDKVLRALRKKATLDAGYNNVTLIGGKSVTKRIDYEFEASDNDAEILIQKMARELLRARAELRKIGQKS